MAGKLRYIYYSLNKYIFSFLPNAIYHNLLGWIMHRRFGVKYHWMDISRPRTFSEKIQWLKTHGNIKLKTKLADKYDVRDFVIERIGEEYLIDLIPLSYTANNPIWVADSIDQIDFDSLPNKFVMKLTKGSGYNIICNNKDELDINATKKTLQKWLKINNYVLSREPQYKGQNKIICEKMLKYNITDYKFFCFDGKPLYVELYIDRFGKHRKIFYDMNWEKVGFITGGDDMSETAEKPSKFEEMIDVAQKLSAGFNFVRVDLYAHNNKIYFGEMTFHPAGGYTPITPRKWDEKLGGLIKL